MPTQEPLRLGVDLGGSKIEIIAMDGAGRTLTRRRLATPREDYAGCVRTLAGLVLGVEDELGRRGSVGNRHGDSSGVRGAAWLWAKDEAAAARGGTGERT